MVYRCRVDVDEQQLFVVFVIGDGRKCHAVRDIPGELEVDTRIFRAALVGKSEIPGEGEIVAIGVKVTKKISPRRKATRQAATTSGEELIAIFNVGTGIQAGIVAIGIHQDAQSALVCWRVDDVDQLRGGIGVAVVVLGYTDG